MKALTKAMLEERGALVTALHETFADLEREVARFNVVMANAWDAVEAAMAPYNAAVGMANDWKSAIASEIQAYIDERSDKWQESVRGQAYQEWLSEYEYGELQHADLDIAIGPASLTLDGDQADMLEGLSEAVPE